MKTAIYSAMISLCFAAGMSFADTPTPDAAAYQQSIMAFGVNSESAQQAAETAVQNIEQQKAESSSNEEKNLFATISDEIVSNPYGF